MKFIDTNVLVYVADDADGSQRRRMVATRFSQKT